MSRCAFVASCLPIALCAALSPSALYSSPMPEILCNIMHQCCLRNLPSWLTKPAGTLPSQRLPGSQQAHLQLTCLLLQTQLTEACV